MAVTSFTPPTPHHISLVLLLTLMGCGDNGSHGAADADLLGCSLNSRLRVYGAGVYDGYTLYAPMHSYTTYLIDICGEVVHTWESSYTPGLATYLLENGNLLRAGAVGGPAFNPTTSGGIVEELDWDSAVVWSYTYCDDQRCAHHDIEPLPGGNVLLIAWEKKNQAEAIAAGRDPALLGAGELWPDHIIEVEPTYPEGGTIVWQWHAWDHLVQDFDPGQANFGVVADHPELMDLHAARYATGQLAGAPDLHHINSIDYNPELDQLLLSVHTTDEIIVIDHSTTTAEAAVHTGGNYGRGGDILYRWGNPSNYDAGDFAQRDLSAQHHAHWIEPGLPGATHLLIFNNGRSRGYSSVDELVPPMDASGLYPLTPSAAWGPQELFWQYVAPNPGDFYALSVSGAQRLPNGNTLITDGPGGVFFEVTSAGERVWSYHLSGDQYFRATRYGPEYPGLSALDP